MIIKLSLLNDVYYKLNVETDMGTKDSFQYFRDLDYSLYLDSKEDFVEIWKEIGIYYCNAYLHLQFIENNLENMWNDTDSLFNSGDKTNNTFKNLLDQFSIGQIYNLIWRAVRDAIVYKNREHLSIKYTRNVAIHNINYKAAKVIDNQSELENFNPTYKIENDAISSVFFDQILKSREKGFETVPNSAFLDKKE